MFSCPESNPGSSCQQTLQTSTAPLKSSEILEKSAVSQISGFTPRQEPFFSSFGLEPSSEPCRRIFYCSVSADIVKPDGKIIAFCTQRAAFKKSHE